MNWRFALAVIGLCACMGFAPSAERDAETPPTIEIPDQNSMRLASVVRVIDGDSLVLEFVDDEKDILFELLAVNAPEYVDRDSTPRKHAREAWFALRSLLDGEWVYVHLDPAYRTDAAGRMTGYLFRSPDMLFVNQEILRQGHAEHESRRSAMFADVLSFWETHARDAEKGLWNPDPVVLVEQPEPVPAPDPVEIKPALEIPPATLTPVRTPSATNERFVYLTKSGSKYHTKKCRYYSENCTRVRLSDARKSHSPCKVCKPDESED